MIRLIAALAAFLAVFEAARAHGLSARWEIADGSFVLRAASDGEPAAGATVEVRTAGGELLAEGALDAAGTWRWPIRGTGELKVVVDAGMGHRQTLSVPLAPSDSGGTSIREGEGTVDTHGDHDEDDHVHVVTSSWSTDESLSLGVRVLAGLALVCALSALWMSYGNTRRLAALERQWKDHEGRG